MYQWTDELLKYHGFFSCYNLETLSNTVVLGGFFGGFLCVVFLCTIRHLEMTIPYRVHDSVYTDYGKKQTKKTQKPNKNPD